MKIWREFVLATACYLLVVLVPRFAAADDAAPSAQPASQVAEDKADKQKELFAQFEKTLSGSALVGNFTVLGNENKPLSPERYEIESVSKLDAGDYWLFQARIKYGKRDLKLPLPLEVKWADDTPVITLTNLIIPGLGKFSARVIIRENKYAGTWTHDKVGGHLFGKIERADKEDKQDKDDRQDNDEQQEKTDESND